MQTKSIKYFSKAIVFTSLCLLMVGTLLNSCNKDKEGGNGVTVLNSFGPSPIVRGAELRFIGENLDKVTSILLPDSVEIPASAFTTKTSTLITITVPQDAMPGFVKLRAPQGNIITKTLLRFSEPITATGFSPASTQVDSIITINGDYLNLIHQVIFTDRVVVGDTAFITHTRNQIQVRVPAAAQTGKIAISNGAADPIILYSIDSLKIKLPTYGSISPTTIKAGSLLTITGTDLNLIKKVIFGGNRIALDTAFKNKSATQFSVKVPTNAEDGRLKLVAISGVIIQGTDSLVMTVPSIDPVTPNPVKPGANITVTGSDLDLITSVTFGGGKTGTILEGRTAAQISVTVPLDATSGIVKFGTDANKSVNSPSSLTMVKPVISSITPMTVITKDSITIAGTDLDLVISVQFVGDKTVNVANTNATQFKVKVPVGAQSGAITLVTKNGDQVVSASLTINPADVPGVTSIPSLIKPGSTITITGSKMDLFTDVIFPGNIKATMFGTKTSTSIQVVVPANVPLGKGNIQFVTKDGDSNQSPDVYISKADPVVDESLVFFNFNGKNSWWGDQVTEGDPLFTLDGSSYAHINKTYTGWGTFFARNGKNDLPVSTIGTNVSHYVYKFDINTLEPITAGVFQCRFNSSTNGDYWFYWNPWSGPGTYTTNGWITITIPLSSFLNDGKAVSALNNLPISDMNTIDGEFSINMNTGSWAGGDSKLNVLIDNVRFEYVP